MRLHTNFFAQMVIVGGAIFLSIRPAPAAEPVECLWVDDEITLDGELKEAAWSRAAVIDTFGLPWLKDNVRPPRTATRARLLWDRDALYFAAEMTDRDLVAQVTEHDGQTWHDDVFELFFKPSDRHPGYYEFQVTPAGVTMEMFVPERGTDAYEKYKSADRLLWETAVAVAGTVNDSSDADRGWTVEGRIPWTDMLMTGGRPSVGETWTFALCRYDYGDGFEEPELSSSATLSVRNFHHHEDYAPVTFVGPDAKTTRPHGVAERKPFTTSRVIGAPDPPPPYQAQRIYPEWEIRQPMFVATEPGSGRLMFIDYGSGSDVTTRLCRTTDDPASGKTEVLLELSDLAFSFCFDPEYAENRFLYVGSNGSRDEAPKHSRVTRYRVPAAEGAAIDEDDKLLIIEWPSDGHNGAAVAFGLDGMLYVTSGDGTSDSDTNLTGQGLDHLLAKLLRIDVREATGEKPYQVPADNPFVGQANVRPETWAYGFRNPWRIAVDPQQGHIWVGNNGQDLWEQIYLVERGANYGWSVYEGSHLFYRNRELGPQPLSKPAFEHSHAVARSLTGGVVYFGEQLPDLVGAYIYGDYSTGKIWAGKLDGNEVLWHREIADTSLAISGFGLGPNGELLICDYQQKGGLYTLVPNEDSYDPAEFPRKLSETGLFASVAEHQPAEGVIPYSVNSPLWSDGAIKARFVAMPEKADADGNPAPPRINYNAKGAWGFDDGTVLVKSFALEMQEGDPSSRKWIETRLMTRQQGEWVGYSYAWNDEQTEATLVESAGADRLFEIHGTKNVREQMWHFPGRAECMVCHSRAAGFVLGLSTAQLNREHNYHGVADNQLRVWEHLGLINVPWGAEATAALRRELEEADLPPAEAQSEVDRRSKIRGQRSAPRSEMLAVSPARLPKMADPYDSQSDLDARAKAYLHTNCAMCHVRAGGGNAQMVLDFDTPRDEMFIINEKPVHHNYGLDDPRLIAPGSPERSLVLKRMAIRGAGQMPQLATSRVDEAAAAMLRDWILGLEPPTDSANEDQ